MPLSSYREFDAALAFAAQSAERTMERLLPKGDEGEARVFEAMRYASLGGGKRLRAFFVLAGATLFRVGAVPALRTASAPCNTMNSESDGSPCATSTCPRTRS